MFFFSLYCPIQPSGIQPCVHEYISNRGFVQYLPYTTIGNEDFKNILRIRVAKQTMTLLAAPWCGEESATMVKTQTTNPRAVRSNGRLCWKNGGLQHCHGGLAYIEREAGAIL